jgi:tetratricopeptide (TPR) repeat protein
MTGANLQILVCSVALLACQPGYAIDDSEKTLERSKRLIDTGKPQAAKLMLRELIRKSPKSAEAHMQLGAALASLAEKDQYDEAIAEEETAIQLDPKSSGARRILGMIYANQRKYDQAIALLREASDLSPSSFAARRDLGAAYLAAGKTEDAIASYQQASAINPANLPIRLKLAAIFLNQEKYAEAIKESEQAIKLDESKAEAHLSLANAKLQSGDFAGSAESFKRAGEANGFDSFGSKNPLTAAAAYSGLGWAMVQSRNSATKEMLAEAVSYQRKAIKAYPHFLPAYVRLAQLLEKQDKPKDAEALYKRIFVATQYDPSVGIPYARFLTNLKRTDEAQAILKMVREKHSGTR